MSRWLCALFVLLIPAALAAQPAVHESTAATPSQPEPTRRADFLFGRPNGAVGLRGAWVFAAAGSDLYDFVARELTVDKSDFNAPGLTAEIALALTPRLDALVGVDWSKTAIASEYRAFVDNQQLPIEQDTTLQTVQLTGSVRLALVPRGHDISRFAWVPRRVVPYVGAGGGAMRYTFQQSGDFVDFVDLSVFPDVFESTGWTPSAHAFAGVDVQIHRGLYATVEGRYARASATLSRDFVDFDPIDLSGFRVSAGINLLF